MKSIKKSLTELDVAHGYAELARRRVATAYLHAAPLLLDTATG